jgi:glycosyltransferase involved in cell wall biosynthesis
MVILSIHSGWQLGGSTLNLGFVVKNLVQSSHKVYVLNRYQDDEGSRYLKHCGAELFYFPKFSLKMNTTTILESSESSVKLEIVKTLHDIVKVFAGFYLAVKYILKYKPDVLYLTESAFPQCILAAKCLRTPIVCELQAELIKGRLGIRRALYIKLLSRSDALFGITRFHVEPFLKASRRRDHIYVIPNTIDVDLLAALPVQMDIRTAYDIPKEKKLVCYFGGVSHIKGPELYLEIAKQTISARDDVVFLFAGPFHKSFKSEWTNGSAKGDFEDTQRLFNFVRENALDKHMRIIGEVTNVISVIRQCDVVVSLNKFPHFSRVIVEAFYCSRPVLASKDKFSREIIKEGINGLLAEFSNVQDWLIKLNSILDNPDYAETMGKEGRKTYESTFDLPIVSAQINEMFSRACLGNELRALECK